MSPSGWCGERSAAAPMTPGEAHLITARDSAQARVTCPHVVAPGWSARLPDDRGADDPRDAAHGTTGDLLAQGLHPAHDAVPRQVRVLHLRPAAGPPRRARPHPRPGRCAIARAGARRGLPRGALHPRRAPEERYPVRGRVAGRPRLRLHRRLPRGHVPAGARRDRAAAPRQRRRPLRRRPGPPPNGVARHRG